MAKRLDLSAEMLATPVTPPQAARILPTEAPVSKVQNVPLQIRIPRAEVKAIKRAAVDADKNISEFMLECFHVCMQTRKQI